MCRSRRELSNAYLLAKFGFDTAENEPSKKMLAPWESYVSGASKNAADVTMVWFMARHSGSNHGIEVRIPAVGLLRGLRGGAASSGDLS